MEKTRKLQEGTDDFESRHRLRRRIEAERIKELGCSEVKPEIEERRSGTFSGVVGALLHQGTLKNKSQRRWGTW